MSTRTSRDPQTESFIDARYSQGGRRPSLHAAERASVCDLSPLMWWRIRPAKNFEPRDVQRIRAALRDVSRSVDAQWQRAINGQADAAIGVAVRVLWKREKFGVSNDAAMSSVMACALEGDLAAIFLVGAALDRRAKVRPGQGMLADWWLVASIGAP